MPELPEVESVVRTLRDGSPSLAGQRIDKVEVLWNGVVSTGSITWFKTSSEGCMVKSIGRHGKYLILNLEARHKQGFYFLIIHLRMTGRLYLVPHDRAIGRHTRLALILNGGLALRFDDPRKFGRVWLVEDLKDVLGNLGPDALGIGFKEFVARFTNYRRQLKPLLLDQSFLAGIGNIYADEILFRAGLHPLTISSNLQPDEIQRLHGSIISVLEEAVAANGANIDGVFAAGGFAVNVYGREGKPCPVCGTVLVKIRVGQRGTHICPRCQPILQA